MSFVKQKIAELARNVQEEGYLMKLSGFVRKTYKREYFVLTNQELIEYCDDEDAAEQRKPKGSADITLCQASPRQDSNFHFEVNVMSEKPSTIQFMADSRRSRDFWVEKINAVSENSRRTHANRRESTASMISGVGDDDGEEPLESVEELAVLDGPSDPKFITEIAQKLDEVTFAMGDLILEEGEEGDAMFFIVRGSVIVHAPEPIVLSQGQFFGEMALFLEGTEGRRAFDVSAGSTLETRRLSRKHTDEILMKFPLERKRLLATGRRRRLLNKAVKSGKHESLAQRKTGNRLVPRWIKQLSSKLKHQTQRVVVHKTPMDDRIEALLPPLSAIGDRLRGSDSDSDGEEETAEQRCSRLQLLSSSLLGQIDRMKDTIRHWDIPGKKDVLTSVLTAPLAVVTGPAAGGQPPSLLDSGSSVRADHKQAVLNARPMLHIRNLVFQGGGVRGSAYLGALEVLNKTGILHGVRRCCGSSAGSIVAMIVTFFRDDFDALRAAFHQIDFNKMGDGARHFGFVRDNARLMTQFGWYRGETFVEWVQSVTMQRFGKESITFKELQNLTGMELHVYGVNVSRGKPVVFSPHTTPDMHLVTAVRISISIPLFYRAVFVNDADIDPVTGNIIGNVPTDIVRTTGTKHEQEVFVDGGMLENFPVHHFDTEFHLENYVDGEVFGTHPERVIFNKSTLGLRVDEPEALGYVQEAAPEHEDDGTKSLLKFVEKLLDTLLNAANDHKMRSCDWDRAIRINTLGVSSTDLDITDEMRELMFRQGEVACWEYLYSYIELNAYYSNYVQGSSEPYEAPPAPEGPPRLVPSVLSSEGSIPLIDFDPRAGPPAGAAEPAAATTAPVPAAQVPEAATTAQDTATAQEPAAITTQTIQEPAAAGVRTVHNAATPAQ